MKYTEVESCRVCGGNDFSDRLDLGEQPPANAFSMTPFEIPKLPLRLMQCGDCGLVQIGHVADCSELFSRYSFLTSSSSRMAAHFASLMQQATSRHVPYGGLVVEIGSNDGTALASITRRDVRKLGVDPAQNIAAVARERGIETRVEFFCEESAGAIIREHGQASLIVACNVLGHIHEVSSVIAGVDLLLTPGGAFVFEVPYVCEMVTNTEFDTIYHEHLSYFGIGPLARLLEKHGLRLSKIEPQDVHGGTIRCTATRNGNACDLSTWIQREREMDWSGFASRSNGIRHNLHEWLVDLADEGMTVCGYGAPAKGTVMLNYCGIGEDLLPFVVDSTPLKQSSRVPGTGQLILSPDAITGMPLDAILILAWNHAGEIAAKEPGRSFATPQQFE